MQDAPSKQVDRPNEVRSQGDQTMPQIPEPQVIDLGQEPDRCLGALAIRPRAGCIGTGDRTVRLEPRLMQVLIALADTAPEVATRQELSSRAWGGVVVGDDALNRCIARLRRALADLGAGLTIETVPKLGYRLDIPTIAVDPVPLPETVAPRGLGTWGPANAAGAVACAALALIASGVWRPHTSGDFALGDVSRLASTAGRAFDPALSPDGRQIAFARLDSDASADIRIHIRNLTDGAERPLNDDRGVVNPAWSPDGRLIAYVQTREGAPCRLLMAEAGNGARREIGACATAATPNIAWSPDGRVLYFEDAQAPESATRIMGLDVARGAVSPVTPAAASGGDFFPTPSPDGNSLVFLREEAWLSGHVLQLDLNSGALRRITQSAGDIYGLAFAPDARSLLVSANWGGDIALWRLDVSGGATTRLSAAGGLVAALTRGGSDRLAFETRDLRRQLMLLPSKQGNPMPLVASAGSDLDPDVSALDGRVAFISTRSGRPQLWVAERDGALRQLSDDAHDFLGGPRWSPDGASIAVSRSHEGRQDIHIYPAAGGVPRSLTQDAAIDIQPQWIEGGRAILFASHRDGRWGLWRVPVDGGVPASVMPDARVGAMAPDGSMVFQRTDRPGLWFRASPRSRSVEVSAERLSPFARISYDRGAFWLLDRVGFDEMGIRRFRPESGLSATIWRGRFDLKSQLTFARDGRPIISVRTGTETQVFVAELLNS